MKQIIRVETKSLGFHERNLMLLRQAICNSHDLNPWQEINVEIYRRILRNEEYSKADSRMDFNRFCEFMMNLQKSNGNLLKKNDRWYVWNPHTYLYV